MVPLMVPVGAGPAVGPFPAWSRGRVALRPRGAPPRARQRRAIPNEGAIRRTAALRGYVLKLTPKTRVVRHIMQLFIL